MDAIAGLVLAGGQATRMGGGDKALLEVGGRSIIARVLEALRADVAALAISANGDPARFAEFGLPVLADDTAHGGRGPLAGLLAGLGWAARSGAAWLLTVPADTPFLPAGLAAALAPAPSFASGGGRDHNLIALWPAACRDPLRTFLGAGSGFAVHRFGAQLGMRRVDLPGGEIDSFFNVNTPEDLAAAREMAKTLP